MDLISKFSLYNIGSFDRISNGKSSHVSGKWSSEKPRCEPILCPPIESSNAKLQLLEHNNSFGGRVVFACMWGHRLSGSQSMKCEDDGVWDGSMPTCTGEPIFFIQFFMHQFWETIFRKFFFETTSLIITSIRLYPFRFSATRNMFETLSCQ